MGGWEARGRRRSVGGHEIFVVDEGPRADDAIVLLHGFPSSSCDWRVVVSELARRHRVLTFDFLGYGLSDKPAGARYSLFEQADLAEAVLADAGITTVALVSHDMGDSVAAELLKRAQEGGLAVTIERAILTNGSIFIDMAHLSAGQQLLLSLPDEQLPDSLPLDGLTSGLRETFSDDHAPSDDEIEAMVSLLQREGGDRLLPRLIRYIEERRAHQERWTSGLVDFAGPLSAIWGEQDPIAVVAMTDRLLELRPDTDVERWPDVSHWPSIEVPVRLAAAIERRR